MSQNAEKRKNASKAYNVSEYLLCVFSDSFNYLQTKQLVLLTLDKCEADSI